MESVEIGVLRLIELLVEFGLLLLIFFMAPTSCRANVYLVVYNTLVNGDDYWAWNWLVSQSIGV